MPEDSKESKAKKLAAARKKLREFQAKDKRDTDGFQAEQPILKPNEITAIAVKEGYTPVPSPQLPTNHVPVPEDEAPKIEEDEAASTPLLQNHSPSNGSIETIQILIAEKAALSSELNKFRNICREKELENEELQTQFSMTSKRLEELQKEFLLQQKTMEELNSSSLTLQVQMERIRSQNDDQTEHLEETKKLLAIEKDRNLTLQNELKAASNELELSKIRINQLSDEASISKDNRVETLTQTQFMYEQQIRDLQAMVQQLTRDKEQANQQYQTYVQHLNSEVTTLNEKNNELTEECSKLQDRERQFIEHISSLEREIQKSISKQTQFKENQLTETNEDHTKEIEELKVKLAEHESERYEFQLKIKSQEDRLDVLNANLSAKDSKISEMEEHIQNILSERPDNGKLLATMESDKIAASRALTQNDALKKQLDELEMKFVQLTNDKADLVNKLDAEEYVNREIRGSFRNMEEQLENLDKKLHFKDEEMIRLTHENNDLARQNLVLQQQLDRLQHYEARYYLEKFENGQEQSKHNSSDDHDHSLHEHDNCHGDHDHEHGHTHKDDHNHEHGHSHKEDHNREHGDNHGHDHAHNHDHGHDHSYEHNTERHSECSSGHAGHDHSHSPTTSDEHDHPKAPLHSSAPASPDHNHEHSHQSHSHRHVHSHYRPNEPPTIPTVEALQKLQSRFTKLMAQVADLTEEKQRLEHLVLQLQGETETIGEYIALYQTQRRILKQREYEKAAQLQLLLAERDEMREKITTLNKLVSNLGLELPNNLRLNENLNNVMENICIEPNVSHPAARGEPQEAQQAVRDEAAMNKRLNSNESKEILVKIQNIITEIKENTKDIPPVHAADHLTCCSGKFETV